MFRYSLALLMVAGAVGVGVGLSGCRAGGGNKVDKDMAMSSMNDLKGVPKDGSTGDMLMLDNFTDATPHDVDVGDQQKNAAVKFTGVVAITPVYFFEADSHTKCQYEVWVQDPACNDAASAPCGIVILDPTKYPMSNSQCPFPDKSTSLLKDIVEGDNLDVWGIVDTFPDGTPDADHLTVVQHEVEIQKIDKTAGTATVDPITLTADADITAFVSKKSTLGSDAANPKGYNKFEGTLVKLAPSGKKLTITSVADFTTTYVNRAGLGATLDDNKDVSLSPNFSSYYRPKTDGGKADFPVKGQQFTSITGVVNNIFGGSFMPIFPEHWQP